MAHPDFQGASFDPTVFNTIDSTKSATMGDAAIKQEFASPLDQIPGSGNLYDSTPFLDYDIDESNFDWSNDGTQLIGDLPDVTGRDQSVNDDEEDEGREKRKNPDDENGTGRQGDSERGNKKPGRKPLTSEPTSKRKAQNRAAQRAFRERKEKHLKDLETKVEDLEKASEAANHENGLLRAQVERLQTELREYRKRLSVGPQPSRSSPQSQGLSAKTSWDINNNFQFAFPKFGPLTAEPASGAATMLSTANAAAFARTDSMSNQRTSSTGRSASTTSPAGNLSTGSIDELNNLFSPYVSGSVNGSETDYASFSVRGQKKSPERAPSEVNTNSPASSANNGFTSSCVTTPECSAESPDQRKAGEAAFNSINVESQRRKSTSQAEFCKEFATACGNKSNPVPPMMTESDHPSAASTSLQPNTPGMDSQGFDWFANQNGGVFDPVLFGDYRDTQANIMSSEFGNFFNDAFPVIDLTNDAPANPLEPALPKKRDLMKEIEENQTGKEPEVVPGDNPKQFLTCNMLWDRVQRSQKVQSGEADMDDLCSQLKAKAKCSGQGAVIDQKDVDAILGPAPEANKDFFKMFK